MKSHVVLKSSRSGLRINLDPDCTFPELLEDLGKRFSENAGFWGNVQMTLQLEGRKLTPEEERAVVNSVSENSGIDILCVLENDPDRMERSERTLNQKLLERELKSGHFYRGNLRRGETLESESSIVVIGNVEKGARVTAKGNIVILGALSGTACAGVSGRTDAFVFAMEMTPREIRIASYARQFDCLKKNTGAAAELAFLENCEISTKKPINFLASQKRNLKNMLEK